jgi:hypothetical protein
MSYPNCSSVGISTCLYASRVVAPGFYCERSVCYKCPIGKYGNDGKKCRTCPATTWTSSTGQSKCSDTLIFSTPGLIKSYIPMGVSKINVKLWGGGGAGDVSGSKQWLAQSGGSGGFASCNITVVMPTNIYVVVAGGGTSGSFYDMNPGG